MQQIFTEEPIQQQDEICVTGEDARHLSVVLRMHAGEQLRISDCNGDSFLGEILSLGKEQVQIRLLEQLPSTELKKKIYLFQAIPKGERMEFIIEKAVELGVYEIIPVEMKYCVVKLDDKKKASRLKRYQSIAKAAARQSKRSYVPQVHSVMTFAEALDYAGRCDLCLVPYESKRGMKETAEALDKLSSAASVSIMIGPEGGFAKEEIDLAIKTMDVISLGKRILRTDTAAITAMSMVMLACEEQE
jgi:16S rRNA (uracil1498-N3)-methyltransferase